MHLQLTQPLSSQYYVYTVIIICIQPKLQMMYFSRSEKGRDREIRMQSDGRSNKTGHSNSPAKYAAILILEDGGNERAQ